MPDFNQAEQQREFGEVIPDGTFVVASITLKPGGLTCQFGGSQDAGLFKASKEANSDVTMLEMEFTIQGGPYMKRKWFQHFTLDGGARDDHGNSKGGNISKSAIRAILESNRGILPADQSPQAAAARQIESYRQLDSMVFCCRLSVEAGQPDPRGGNYPDKNVLAPGAVVTPEMPEYMALRNGQEVAPQPRAIRRPAGGGNASGGPQAGGAWAQPPGSQTPPPPPPQQQLFQPQPQSPPPPPPAPAPQPSGGFGGGFGGQGGGQQQQADAGAAGGDAAGPQWLRT